MKRTKDSLITIIVLGVVMASFLIGIIAVTNFRNVIDENNHEILLHHCKENSEIMNKRFSEVETLVNALSDYYVEQMDSPDALGEEGFLTGYTEETGKIAYSIARNNPSIVAVYLRLNPEITNPTAGFLSAAPRSQAHLFFWSQRICLNLILPMCKMLGGTLFRWKEANPSGWSLTRTPIMAYT